GLIAGPIISRAGAPAPHESDQGWDEDDLFALVKRAYPYRNLSREIFDSIIEMLSEGIAARRGRYGAYIHHDRVNRKLRARRGAPPTVPFWRGEAPARTEELSFHVAELRREISERLQGISPAALSPKTPQVSETIPWLAQECGLDESGASQSIQYVLEGRAVL